MSETASPGGRGEADLERGGLDPREVAAVEAAQRTVADRLLAADGSVYQAFRNTACGLDPDVLAAWWQDSPVTRAMDDSGKAFGCALGFAMMAVEADRKLRRQGRWWVFR